MADLIDRQALMDGYKYMGYDSTEHPEESYMEGWCKGFNSGVEHCIHHLIHAPSVEAEPVRHGKWIDMADFEQCSSCSGTRLKEMQTVYGEAIWIKTPYCPNCGARMDEVT